MQRKILCKHLCNSDWLLETTKSTDRTEMNLVPCLASVSLNDEIKLIICNPITYPWAAAATF